MAGQHRPGRHDSNRIAPPAANTRQSPARQPAHRRGRLAHLNATSGVVTDTSDATGVYYNEKGQPMKASKQASDPQFADRYIAETRALLATLPANSK